MASQVSCNKIMSKVLHKVLISSSELLRPLYYLLSPLELSINLEKDAIFLDFEVLKKFLTSIPVGHCSRSRHSVAGIPAREILKDD